MAKISADCIAEAWNGLKNFPKEELEQYVRDVFTRARSYSDVSNMRAYERAVTEINDETKQSLFEDANIKANNIRKFENRSKDMASGKYPTMRNLLVSRGKFLADSVAASKKAELEKFASFFFDDLTHEEVEHFTNRDFNEVIADIYDGKEVKADPMSTRIAEKLKEYFPYRNSQMILSNAMKLDEINEDRLFRQVHDAQKIMNGGKSLIKLAMERAKKVYDPAANKILWRNKIKQHLDLEATFQHTEAMGLDGKLDIAAVDKILNRIYDNITTGKSQIFTKSVVANDREAVAQKSRMFFKWKGMRDQLEYSKVYGHDGLFEMLQSDLHGSSSRTGIAKMWGDNPQTMYNDLRKTQQEVNPKSNFWWRNTDNYFKSVMGIDQGSVAPNVSNFMANLRALTSMARLPMVGIDSVSDVGYVAAFAQRIGLGYWRAYTDKLTHLFDTFKTEDRQRIAKLMKTQVDSHMGYMGRWADVSNMSSFVNKISTKYFKVNLLHALDRGDRIGNFKLMANVLNDNSKSKLADLPPALGKYVAKFLTSDEWDLLRKKNQGGMFTTDNVTSLTDAELRDHYAGTDKSNPLSELKDDLYRKVHSMFVINGENTVLSPGDFEKAWLWQGTSPGTIPGDFLRTVMQFKMYALAYIDRVLVQGFNDADSVSQKLMWATSMFMGTLPLSVMGVFFDNILKNTTMPDPSRMNVPDREQYLMNLLLPSLSLFSGLLDPRNENSSMVWGLLGSPTTRLISNAMAAPTALAEGDPKRAAKNLGNAANYIFPIQTTPLITPLINAAFGTGAKLQPGQSHIIGN